MLGDWIEQWKSGLGYWCVRRDEYGLILGVAGVRRTDIPDQFNLYYRFAPDAWGQGFATEAVRYAISRVAVWPEANIVALIRPDNRASVALAERAGLTFHSEIVDSLGSQLRFTLQNQPLRHAELS